MTKLFKSVLWILIILLLLLGIPKLSGIIAGLFNYNSIDPDGAFAWFSVRHIIQALFFIVIIIIFKRYKPIEYGFKKGNSEIGKKYLYKYTIIVGIGSIIFHLIAVFTNTFEPFAYPLTATNIFGQLGFQLFLSGPSEELIFRAFAITMLTFVVSKRILKGKVSLANIMAALIFGLAHVSFSFFPFGADYNLFQVIFSVVLGFFYGDCYEKTKSVYYPMLMHSIFNVISVGLTVIVSLIV